MIKLKGKEGKKAERVGRGVEGWSIRDQVKDEGRKREKGKQ